MSWSLLSACARRSVKGAQLTSSLPQTSASPIQPTQDQATSMPGFLLLPMESIAEQVTFASYDGMQLAGQLDFPPQGEKFDLVFIIHHADPVNRDIYQYLAAKLVPLGFAVFRFDKRGTGSSAGVYGCCEAEDALAAYRAAVTAQPEKIEKVFILAQSIGTKHLASQFDSFNEIKPPAGVILLSSLLSVEEVLEIRAPILIVISDHEPERITVSEAAVSAHQNRYPYGANFKVAKNTEHTLFDISQGMIDWNDPTWTLKFSADAWDAIRAWLESHR